MKRIYLCTLLAFLTAACSDDSPDMQNFPEGTFCYPNDKGGYDCHRNGNAALIIPEQDIAPLKVQALNGSGEAALKLGNYYSFVRHEEDAGSFWTNISAEDGYPIGMRSWAAYLEIAAANKEERPYDPKLRAEFWRKRAKDVEDHSISDALENQ